MSNPKIKEILNLLPEYQDVQIATFNYNADTMYLTDVHKVYDKHLFSTNFEHRVIQIVRVVDVLILYI